MIAVPLKNIFNSWNVSVSHNSLVNDKKEGKKSHTSHRRPTRATGGPLDLILTNQVSVAWSNSSKTFTEKKDKATRSIITPPPLPLGGMLVHLSVTPPYFVAVPIYTPGWRETMWIKFLTKQHNSREQASNHRPSNLNLNALTQSQLRDLKRTTHFRCAKKAVKFDNDQTCPDCLSS